MSTLIINERGAVLVTGLLFLSILTILGTSAYLTTSSDIDMSRNFRLAKTAFYNAEAGVEEAKFRLKGTDSDANYIGDPQSSGALDSSGYDTTWTAYVFTEQFLTDNTSWKINSTTDDDFHAGWHNYMPTAANHEDAAPSTSTSLVTADANSLENSMSYWFKIRHKRESDAVLDGHGAGNLLYGDDDNEADDNIIYYGYPTAAFTTAIQFTCCDALNYTTTDAHPVEIVTSYGSRGDSTLVNQMEVVQTLPPPIPAALYSKGGVTGNGTMGANGNDNCNTPPTAAKPATYTLDPATTCLGNHSCDKNDELTPVGSETVGTADLDISDYIDALKGGAVQITTDIKNPHYSGILGSPTDYKTYYCDADTYVGGELEVNLSGYGVLLVDGNVDFSGNTFWKGLIIVTGSLTITGGVDIEGAVLAGTLSDLGGNSDILYNSCDVAKAVAGQSATPLFWRQVR